MPPTLTNRELKNKSTGIDIIVPEYQIIPGKIINTVLYHIIVITRLFYFKTRQHKESDLVQFAVAKKYDEVEDLHTKLVAKFPSVKFDSLPKMSLIITDKVLNERKNFLEKLLNLIAKTPKLCSSSPVLDFLEANKISIKQNQLRKGKPTEPEKPKEEIKADKPVEVERDIFGITQVDSGNEDSEENSDEDEEDTSVVDMKRPSATEKSKPMTKISPGISDTSDDTSDDFLKSSGKFSFGTAVVPVNKDFHEFFIPKEALMPDKSPLFLSEDDPELLKIDDDLDKLLNISKKSNAKKTPSPKPRAPPRPDLKPRPTPKPRFVETNSSADTNFLSKPSVPPKPKPRTRSKPESDTKTEEKQPEPIPASRPKDKSQGTLGDIFDRPSKKDLFSEVDDDEEDLFKPQPSDDLFNPQLASEDIDVDDITKYIEKNIGQTTFDKVDLFS